MTNPGRLTLRVNGEIREVTASPDATLLEVLRERLGLTGSKESCGRGECGACTVLVDGRPAMSCATLAATVTGEVTTIEGLAEEAEDLRRGFADHYGFQCGFCTSGQIVRGHGLLVDLAARGESISRETVLAGMSGNICRCTGYAQIVDAVMAAAAERGIAIEGPGPEARTVERPVEKVSR